MPFKKGESGNPGGALRTEKRFAEALRFAVMRAQRDKVGLQQVANSSLVEARKRNVAGIRQVVSLKS